MTAIAIGAAAGLIACGSSSQSKTVPKSQVVSKGDAICSEENKTVTAKPPGANFNPATATPAQIKATEPFLRQQATAVRNSVTRVAALGKPDKDAALLDRLLADGRISATEISAAADAAANGNKKRFATELSKTPDDTKLAKEFGFKVCAQGG